MTDAKASHQQPLDEFMLAMDVVDTLRRGERLAEKELNAEDRERALKKRLREIYASQGIEVSEHVLAEGVAALREERFTYQPPERGFDARLATLYVNRDKWMKPALIGVGVLLVGLVAFQLGSRGLEHYRLEQRKAAVAEAQASWNEFLRSKPTPQVKATGDAILTRVEASLERGETKESQTQLAQLKNLQKLQNEFAAIRTEAKTAKATALAQQDYAAGLTALREGDDEQSQAAIARLEALRAQLAQEYTLRIVSRPGEPSGVWRVPAQNPTAHNYYLIVEAIAPNGKRLSLPVTSEEDGKTSNVDQWGVRVSEQAFERVRMDKQDDGIIQNDQVGIKRRGYLEPEYLLSASAGGAITSW